MKKLVLAIAVVAAVPVLSLQAVVCPDLIVTNAADSGPGTLREAILRANECPGTNTILFNIPGAGVHTIMPVGGLPIITGPAMIDGWSQPQIELNGLLSPTSFGLNIQSSNCIVRGLTINGFAAPGGNGFGIGLFTANARSNWIYACRLGSDVAGSAARPNGQGGIWIGTGATGNLIGSDFNGVQDAEEGNVISGNNGHGILLQGSGNRIAGNRIGTDATGAAKLPNTQHGIYLNNSGHNVIADNVISGNGRARFDGGLGIFLRFPNAAQNVIVGNRIGTTADGTAALANTTSGIALSGGAHDNRIGTDGDGVNDLAERNLISGNGNDGITVGFVFGDAPVLNTVIAGNFIGTDFQGLSSIPNFDSAVYVISGEGHRIGTDANGIADEAERNLLSGNRRVGVTLDGTPGPTRNITVAGNFIGTDVSGTAALGNPVTGVLIRNGASDNTIGGRSPASANRIAFNGVGVTVTAGERNRILGNSIHDHTGLGIDLGGDGPTLNDAGDGDTGPNGRQNFPILNAVNGGGTIRGTFQGTPASAFELQFFASVSCDTSGFGEGRSFLGSMDIVTSSAGTADFAFAYTPIPGSVSLTATATSSAGDTSEFSPCAVGNTRPVAQSQNVSTLEDTDVVITLGGSDADNDPLTAKITALPTRGAVYQFVGGSRGARFQTSPGVVSDAQRRVIFAPPAQGAGPISFEFVVNDGVEDSAPAVVSVDVQPVNDPPSFTPGGDVDVREDSSAAAVSWASMILPGPENESEQTVMFLVGNDRPDLFAVQPQINPMGLLTFTPAPNLFGQALLTVRLRDSGGTLNGGNDMSEPIPFRINVLPVNDAPSFVGGPDQVIPEDAGPQVVPQWATAISPGPPNEMQSLTFSVSNDQGALFVMPPAVLPDGSLRYETAPNAHGVANVVVVLRDDGGIANSGVDTSGPFNFTITVRPVNDAPTFSAGPDVVVVEDAGPQTFPGWAQNIQAGPPDEAGQAAEFITSTTNPTLFTALPTISPGGVLSFTTAPNAFGMALVSVILGDNGGVDDGGQNRSAEHILRINISPVNDCAVAVNEQKQAVEDQPLSLILGGQDVEGDSLSFVVTQPPAHGTLVGTPPNLTYLPAPDYCGPDQIHYTVSDGDAACPPSSGRIDINVACANDCPNAIARAVSPAMPGETETNYTVIAANNATAVVLFDGSASWDPEGDPLTYAWAEIPWEEAGAVAPNAEIKRPSSPPGCGECRGKVTQLRLRHTGDQAATIRIVQKDGAQVFNRVVLPDEDFTIAGAGNDGVFGDRIFVFVNEVEDGELNTSCGRPIGPGMVFSDFIILEGMSRDGGVLCQLAPVPLTAPRPFAMGPVAEDELFLGRHAITLMVSDGGCVDSTTILVDVITPGQAVEACIALVEAADIHRKERRPLIETLKKAGQEFDKGKFKQGVKKLEAFIKKVEHAVEKERLPAAVGDEFVACIEAILAQLQP